LSERRGVLRASFGIVGDLRESVEDQQEDESRTPGVLREGETAEERVDARGLEHGRVGGNERNGRRESAGVRSGEGDRAAVGKLDHGDD